MSIIYKVVKRLKCANRQNYQLHITLSMPGMDSDNAVSEELSEWGL